MDDRMALYCVVPLHVAKAVWDPWFLPPKCLGSVLIHYENLECPAHLYEITVALENVPKMWKIVVMDQSLSSLLCVYKKMSDP